MARIGDNILELCIERLAGKHGADYQSEKILLHKEFGISYSTLDKISRNFRPSTRAQRRDSGKRRIEATEEEIQCVTNLVINLDHLTYKRAIQISEMNEWIRPGVLPDYMLRKIMHERGLGHRRRHTDVSPAVHWEATYPNEFWELDATKLEHLHLHAETMRVSYNPRL